MNKQITFDEMLASNGLPFVGTIVTTPAGDKVEIVGYAYSMFDKAPRARCRNDGEFLFDLQLDQVRLCAWEGKE